MIYEPGNDGFDGVADASGFHDEPEKHVDHVNEPNGRVEVQAIAKHQFPCTKRFGLEGLE